GSVVDTWKAKSSPDLSTPTSTAWLSELSSYRYRNAYGSVRSCLTQAILISNITTANGSAVIMTGDWSPSKAVSSPSNSITMAMPPITSPQNITISYGGSCRPRVVRIPMTTEAESAAVMKKIAKMTMISNGNHSA